MQKFWKLSKEQADVLTCEVEAKNITKSKRVLLLLNVECLTNLQLSGASSLNLQNKKQAILFIFPFGSRDTNPHQARKIY